MASSHASSSAALPASALASSVVNNHIPPDAFHPSLAAQAALPTREAIVAALAETDTAIHQLEDRIIEFYFRNGTFSREAEGLQNLHAGVDWFKTTHSQATNSGQSAIKWRKDQIQCEEELNTLLTTRNSTTATLVLLNSIHAAFVLSSETERALVDGQVDIAYQQLRILESTVKEIRQRNDSLAVVGLLEERAGVLNDVLAVETEKMWSKLVMFSEEGDIQLTIQKSHRLSEGVMSIETTAELLQSLGLLESTMKSLGSLLSRAFLDHLLENPVGWQFVYTKHDLTAPSITMRPTNYTTPDLTPHGYRIFAYLECISDFLTINLPKPALQILLPHILPLLTTSLCTNWLEKYIPRTLDSINDFEQLTSSAQAFEIHLQAIGWTRENTLQEWSTRSGEIWGRLRHVDILDTVRMGLRRGVLPTTKLMTSHGAVQYENKLPSRNLGSWSNSSKGGNGNGTAGIMGEWTLDDEWSPPSTPLRKIRSPSSSAVQRQSECTALPQQLLPILGLLLQEYTQLPQIPQISRAQLIYPSIFRDMFSLYRMTAVIYANTSHDVPIRLFNDCFYLAGEIGLMGLGMGEMGFIEAGRTLTEISETLDLCGVSWREKYLENIRAGVIERICAAEGFIYPSDPTRRERYVVIISGVLQTIHNLNTLWTQLMMPEDRFTSLSLLSRTTLSQITEDILLLPTLSPSETPVLSTLTSQLLSLETLFPRTRVTEYIPQWPKYKILPQLLEMDLKGVLTLWRTGRLKQTGWDASDICEIVERRFGRSGEGVCREIRRGY